MIELNSHFFKYDFKSQQELTRCNDSYNSSVYISVCYLYLIYG